MQGISSLPGTIASGTSVSNVIDIKHTYDNNAEVVGIKFDSASWTNSHIKIQRADDAAGTGAADFYKPGAEPANAKYEIAIQGGSTVGILPIDVLSIRFIRIVTINGAGGAATNEGAARTFTLITRTVK